MKPVLIVEGKRKNILSIQVEDVETGVKDHFYDSEKYEYMDEKVDFETALVNPSQQKQVINTLNAHLEESEQYLLELKVQIAEEVIQNIGLPFPEMMIKSLVEEHQDHKSYIEGLSAAIELVKGLECEVSSTE